MMQQQLARMHTQASHVTLAFTHLSHVTQDFALSELNEELKYDEKNIRRRVYDALNVLMALEIISKDKKSISWRGFPPFCCESEEHEVLPPPPAGR